MFPLSHLGNVLQIMVAAAVFFTALLTASLSKASRVLTGGGGGGGAEPPTGNIAYTLPTERTFLLNVPETYKHGEEHPLVLSFHGGA